MIEQFAEGSVSHCAVNYTILEKIGMLEKINVTGHGVFTIS